MCKSKGYVIVLGMVIAWCGMVAAAPPLPLHSLEGNSGVLITNTAYLVNPPEKGKAIGLPSFSVSGVIIGQKDLQSYAVTENLYGRIEVGYAAQRLGLGDWSNDVRTATGTRVRSDVWLHTLNLRFLAVEEDSFDCKWMPAVTFGTHFKWNQGLSDINRKLGGLMDTIGADHSSGVEFTAVASKTITGVLPRPIILSAGLRNSDAIHTGFVGFAGERSTTFEGSIIVFLTDRLVFASEYRQKSDHLNQLTAGGKHLVRAENDWWDLLLGYVVNDHMTVSGGYLNLGNMLNHRESNVWALQVKYEF